MTRKFLQTIMLVSFSMQAFCDEKTMPIVQVPRNECTYAFTTGNDVVSSHDYDYYLFDDITVFNEKGKVGTYSSSHGKYVSFSFVGSSSFNGSSSTTVQWDETKQMAFYCAWNDSKLSAFVINLDKDKNNIHLVDLATDNILGSFPIHSMSSYYPKLKIMVFTSGIQTTAIMSVAINCYGGINIYNSLPMKIGNHECVDLGLPSGLLWATTNIGADIPEQVGSYFSWGETASKSVYNWGTYKYANGSQNTLTKYCNDGSYGNVDYKDVLDSNDDAATVNWGSPWRTPTLSETQELISNCTWKLTSQNGVSGYQATGPNGNSIFFPAGGVKQETFICFGDRSCVLSSSLFTYPSSASVLCCKDGSPQYWYGWDRCWGFNVRPVTTKDASYVKPASLDGNDVVVGNYDIMGRMHDGYIDGINIVRMSDGSTKKLAVK